MPAGSPIAVTLEELGRDDRDAAIPVLRASFDGIYRWHATRTLRAVERVRVAWSADTLCGVSLLERLEPEVGYVYYVAVEPSFRGRGVAGRLLDDALAWFSSERLEVAYGAVEEDNAPSLRLFASRGFQRVRQKEPGWREGGLGAPGLRSRMMLVWGEVLLGLRLAPSGSLRRSGPPG